MCIYIYIYIHIEIHHPETNLFIFFVCSCYTCYVFVHCTETNPNPQRETTSKVQMSGARETRKVDFSNGQGQLFVSQLCLHACVHSCMHLSEDSIPFHHMSLHYTSDCTCMHGTCTLRFIGVPVCIWYMYLHPYRYMYLHTLCIYAWRGLLASSHITLHNICCNVTHHDT